MSQLPKASDPITNDERKALRDTLNAPYVNACLLPQEIRSYLDRLEEAVITLARIRNLLYEVLADTKEQP